MTTHQDLPKRVIFGYQRITIGPWEKLTKTSKSFATVNPCVGTLGKSNNTLSHCGFVLCKCSHCFKGLERRICVAGTYGLEKMLDLKISLNDQISCFLSISL